MIGEEAHHFLVATCREELEGADADMARSDAGENGAREQFVPGHGLSPVLTVARVRRGCRHPEAPP